MQLQIIPRNLGFLFFLSLVISCATPPVHRQILPLHEGWMLSGGPVSTPIPATVPGVVHTDLLAVGIIPHPWKGTHEEDVQWVDTVTWVYEKQFEWENGRYPHVDLVMEGLDTYADVYLNDSLILQADNMFRTWRVEVLPHLRQGTNHLKLVFRPVVPTALPLRDALPYRLPASSESVEVKVSPFVRKAPYHFGWDWGPRLLTSGIWKDIYLDMAGSIRLLPTRVETVSISAEEALIRLHLAWEGTSASPLEVEVFGTRHALSSGNSLVVEHRIAQPRLWWPNGWGEAHLYGEKLILKESGRSIDSQELKFGLRTVELVQEQDSIGTSFYFRINGLPLFAKGANYIPPSHFLPSVNDGYYENLIHKIKGAHFNMLRVWGGGIYERDRFYDLCDEAGILIWQDFMFANTTYPGDSLFLENVRAEITDQVVRLRNHPSIVHWNGNNEIAVAWKNWGWQKEFGYSPKDSARQWNDYLHLFHRLIPQQLEALDTGRPYTPTSPLSNWGKPEDFRHGSMHYWGVWHGRESFEAYRSHVGRFMAEYGFQSFPDTATLAYFAPRHQWHLDSAVMRHHQKSYIGNDMMVQMVEKYFGVPTHVGDLVYLSQKAQALAMQTAIEAHRWERASCGGTLFWQLNDCWPGPSWSAIDVFGREKLFFKDLERLYTPVALLARQTDGMLELRMVNDTREHHTLAWRMKDAATGRRLAGGELAMPPLEIVPVWEGPLPSKSPLLLEVWEGEVRRYSHQIPTQ
jgi:beta-mannosidase